MTASLADDRRQRDPLGRAPLFFDASQPYVYGGNNPLNNVDPSGQMFSRQMMDGGDWMPHRAARAVTRRVQTTRARRDVGQHKQRGGPSNSKPGRPNVYAQVMGICSRLPGGICNLIKSKLSSMSTNDWGNVLRTIGGVLVLMGFVVGVIDVIYTLKTQLNKAAGFKIALEFATIGMSILGSLSIFPAFKSSLVYGILTVVSGILSVFTTIYAWYKLLSPWAQIGANVAITGAVTTAEGELAPAEAVGSSVLGAGISYLLASAGDLFLYAGYGLASIGYSLQGA